MSKIKQLPSGNYQTLLFGHMEGKKRIYKSITASSKTDVKKQAAIFLALRDKQKSEKPDLTLKEAMLRYIESKKNVLSPTTYRGYDAIYRNALKDIMDLPISRLDNEKIQVSINEASVNHAPKTVRNICGLLSSTLKMFRQDFILNITLPQKKKSTIIIPSGETVQLLLSKVEGQEIELPIMLAALCGMRLSEICGLTWDNVNTEKKTISIKEAKVYDINHKLVKKGTKTTSGTRTIRLFEPILSTLIKYQKPAGNITDLTPKTIYSRYETMMKRVTDQHYTFHELRHYAVSIMLALNIPKKYIADYVGHKNENMIDRVYAHIMTEHKTIMEDALEDYYKTLYAKQNAKQLS